jgi:hypothetical protein
MVVWSTGGGPPVLFGRQSYQLSSTENSEKEAHHMWQKKELFPVLGCSPRGVSDDRGGITSLFRILKRARLGSPNQSQLAA